MLNIYTAPQMNTWLKALKAGRVVAAPAEGVYGYVADPTSPMALQAVLNMKQRDPRKGLITLIGSRAHLADLCGPLSKACTYAMDQYWTPEGAAAHGPVTLLLPAKAGLHPVQTGGGARVAVRMAFCPHVQAYMGVWGAPLISTSLNLSGQPPVCRAEDIPADVRALTLPDPLPGTVSRIYDPEARAWVRGGQKVAMPVVEAVSAGTNTPVLRDRI